jgi:hypothetical protein
MISVRMAERTEELPEVDNLPDRAYGRSDLPLSAPATEDGKRRGSMSYCSVSASTASMRA